MAGKRTFSVMLSSSFNDLKDLRESVAQRLEKAGLHPIRMEVDDALSDQDVIDASLAKVNDADAYFCLIGRKYGSIPDCPDRNPAALSTTALEFHRAKAQNMPVAGLLLGVNYPVGELGVEFDADKRAKLQDLREAIEGYRVVKTIDDPRQFAEAALNSAHRLRQSLEAQAAKAEPATGDNAAQARPEDQPPPTAPAMYEVRPFSQGMEFLGRARELYQLTEWAAHDSPMLVLEAIGGMGKSALAYRWLKKRAPAERREAAGRLWYSFYEEGASMRDFCVHALAYVEGVPPSRFDDVNKQDLGDRLRRQLCERPWLVVLDGLERLSVAYDRHDKAQMADEEADDAAQGGKDPNLCTDPQDGVLLRQFAGARPSKLLVTTRNMPTELLGPARAPVPGVTHLKLGGLTKDDAEQLLRAADVRGDGAEMRRYLQDHFACHPLMIGVVAGLIRNHAPAPDDFDHWLKDPQGARDLDLSDLDGLVAKRNHILSVAYSGLDADAQKLLARLAFFSHAVSFDVLRTLNPRGDSEAAARDGAAWLSATLADLRRRGLVIWNAQEARYDLHPLVRGFVRGTLDDKGRAEAGKIVADYARTKAPAVITATSSGEELDAYLNAAHALLLGGYIGDAADLLSEDVAEPAKRTGRLRRLAELLDSFFDLDNREISQRVAPGFGGILSNRAAHVSNDLGDKEKLYWLSWLDLLESIKLESIENVSMGLEALADSERQLYKLASAFRVLGLARQANAVIGTPSRKAVQHLFEVANMLLRGVFDWQGIGPAARLDDPDAFAGSDQLRPVVAAWSIRFARHRGDLTNEALNAALNRADVRDNRYIQAQLREEEGRWRQDLDDHEAAIAAFDEAIKIGRADGLPVDGVEAAQALSYAKVGRTEDARAVGERLALAREPANLALAELWLALGESDRARAAALAVYPDCWADGPPYAFYFELQRCRAVLDAVGAPEPSLPSRTPDDIAPYPFEDDVHRLIAEHKAAAAKRRET